MTEKTIKSRIQHKHDTEANWQKATNFIPKSSELIVYDLDENYTYHRFKFGDGVQNVNDLPFSSFSKSYNDLTDKPTIPSTAEDVGALPDTYKPTFYVNATVNASDTTTTLDKTPEQIYAAYNEGKDVYCIVNAGAHLILPLVIAAGVTGGDLMFKSSFSQGISNSPVDFQQITLELFLGSSSSTNGIWNVIRTTLPTKTSQLTNDSGFITSAPVTSVNDKTGAVSLTATDVGALPTSGGTLTGNLEIGSSSIGTNGYIEGTWLRGTASNHLTSTPDKIAVQDANGWVHYRTPSEILSDIGALPNTTKIPTALAVADDGNGNITLSMG